MEDVRAAPPPDVRCAVCHASAVGAEPCAGCGTWVHAECRQLVGRCPTLGCAPPVPALLQDPEARRRALEQFGIRDPRDWRPALVGVPLLVCGLLLYRPDPCSGPSLALAATSIGVAALLLLAGRPRA